MVRRIPATPQHGTGTAACGIVRGMYIRDRIRELRRVPASELAPNPKNWRTHPTEQMDALKGILAEVGYAGAALARELPDGSLMLIDGHARTEVSGDSPIPVLILDVTEEEADKILATFDPLGAMATADTAKLDALLKEVQTDSAAVEAMIAGLAQQHDLAEDVPEPGQGGDEFDATPEDTGPTRTAVGEVWIIGGKHRLMVGDCTDAGTVLLLLKGAKPHLMVTDPPYGVDYDPDWRNRADRANGQPYGASAVGLVSNDHRSDWREAWALFPGDVTYCWHAGRHASNVQASLEAADFEIRCQIIWAKNNFAIGRGDYHWKHEPCWYAVRSGKVGHYNGDRSQTTLWEIDKPMKSETGHSTQKPIECMAKPIENNSLPGDAIYDPFLGSGTTLIAAHRLGRVCYGCEIEPKYADVILKRAEAEGMACERED